MYCDGNEINSPGKIFGGRRIRAAAAEEEHPALELRGPQALARIVSNGRDQGVLGRRLPHLLGNRRCRGHALCDHSDAHVRAGLEL
eukprot:448161-Lingulodinium_polyedra.AAC.1